MDDYDANGMLHGDEQPHPELPSERTMEDDLVALREAMQLLGHGSFFHARNLYMFGLRCNTCRTYYGWNALDRHFFSYPVEPTATCDQLRERYGSNVPLTQLHYT